MRMKSLILCLAISACQAQPRSADYFAAHPEEAVRITADCKAGTRGGRECDTAKAGLAALQAERRQETFRKAFE
jgi:hypothetical protein